MKKVLFIFICLSQLLFSCTPDEELTQVTQDQINNSTIVIEIAPDYQVTDSLFEISDTLYWFEDQPRLMLFSSESSVAVSNVECTRYYMQPTDSGATVITTTNEEFEEQDADITKWHFSGSQSANISMKYKTSGNHYKVRVLIYNNDANHTNPTQEAFPFNNWTNLDQPIGLDTTQPAKTFIVSLPTTTNEYDGLFQYDSVNHLLTYNIGEGIVIEDLNVE